MRLSSVPSRLCLACLLTIPVWGQKYYTYVGDLGTDFALIAWGTTGASGNTIGHDSQPAGSEMVVRIADRTLPATRNWLVVRDLRPDTEYPFEVDIAGKRVGGGTVRTYPLNPTKVCFFVIGDWGSGRRPQYLVAQAMVQEFERRRNSDNPVRFVLSTGDNIYGDLGFSLSIKHSGNLDSDWEDKFFRPYANLLAHIPFHASLGNHDGNESESQSDLPVYLDNFFFPGQIPARYYNFTYGSLVEFFALDSTENSESGSRRPFYTVDGEESRWLNRVLPASRATWKIPYFHHPIFNAGPTHKSSYDDLKHWVDLFVRSGVKVVFNGHEHNFQFTEISDDTGNIRFITSGAGGELRTGDVRNKMASVHMAGWAPQVHFCVVEIDGKSMRVTPISFSPMVVRDRNGQTVAMPVTVDLP